LRKGLSILTPEQYNTLYPSDQKVMTVSDDTTGGALAPPEYVEEIIKGITEFSPVRSVARIRQTSRNSAWVP
ncbi:MAG: phage major capsid protein, partial [Nitrososphaeria archaeon]|nr:phage major capsid protein [Nitrososphaeria archaeon]